jgi:hypothetical protein
VDPGGRVSRARLDPDEVTRRAFRPPPAVIILRVPALSLPPWLRQRPFFSAFALQGVGVISLDACRNDARLMIAAVLSDRQSVKISRG